MTTTSYDAIVIGAGQAGPVLAVRLAQAGLKTALIEREHLGGTCVNDGCIPTKTLVASARAAHVARRAADYGVRIGGPVSVDMAGGQGAQGRVVGESRDSLGQWLAGTAGLDARPGPRALRRRRTRSRSNGERLEAEKIFINVGGRAVLPTWRGIDDVPLLTNTSMMALDALPEHLIDRRRQLHRPRVRADVPALRRRGHGARVRRPPDRRARTPRSRRRCRRSSSGEGIDFRFSVQNATRLGGRRRPRRARRARRRRQRRLEAATCSPPSAAGPTPTTSASTAPASPSTRAATSPSTRSCAPACRASGRSATSTAAAPSRTPPTTTTRSSPTTCSTAHAAASATASRRTRSSSIRRSAASA